MRELEIIQHRQIEGLSLFFDTVEYCTPHFHPEWELIWITDGALSVRYGAKECEGGAGDVFLFYPGQVHEFQQIRENATFLCLQISPQIYRETAPSLGRTVLENCHVNRYLRDEQSRKIRELLLEMMGDYLERPAYYEDRAPAPREHHHRRHDAPAGSSLRCQRQSRLSRLNVRATV